jgi:hypothetical protein
MAVVNLSITIPDAQMARVQAACRAAFGQVDDGAGGFRDLTNAEIVERLRQGVITQIKTMVSRSEREAARIAAEAMQPTVDAV